MKLKRVSVSMARKLIALPTYLKLHDTIALARGKIHSPSFLQNRDVSIRMVLLKLETEPGQRQLKANCLSKIEILTWEVRTRRPQWSIESTQCQGSQPLLQLHHLLIGNQTLSHADTEQLWWPFFQTLTILIFTP